MERFLASAEPENVRFELLSRHWDKRWNKILQAVEGVQQKEGVCYFHHKLERAVVHRDA